MRFTAVVAAFFCLVSLQVLAIANGQRVSDEVFAVDYPWAVVILNEETGGVCGGTLIAPRWVLTAAHCAKFRRTVLVGHADQREAERVEIERALRHPDFDKVSLKFDVGLLYLAAPVDAAPASLASQAESELLLTPNAPAEILGWGKVGNSRTVSDRLMRGFARLEWLEIQGSQYVYDDPQTGPCGFDSGGPMLMITSDDRRLVVGVASATEGNLCAKGGGIALYTRVAAVLDFISTQQARFPAM